MCGRFTLFTPHKELQLHFDNLQIPPLDMNYNITPGQQLATICQQSPSAPEFKFLKWGLVPYWAKDEKIGGRLTNARAETLTEKASFKYAFKKRRCLVIADGYYEWHRSGKKKQPYYFKLDGGQPLALAGIWETWKGGSETLHSCTLITTMAQGITKGVHHRMPLLIEPEQYQRWLDPSLPTNDTLALLESKASEGLVVHPVSSYVNSAKNNDPGCIDPIGPNVKGPQ